MASARYSHHVSLEKKKGRCVHREIIGSELPRACFSMLSNDVMSCAICASIFASRRARRASTFKALSPAPSSAGAGALEASVWDQSCVVSPATLVRRWKSHGFTRSMRSLHSQHTSAIAVELISYHKPSRPPRPHSHPQSTQHQKGGDSTAQPQLTHCL